MGVDRQCAVCAAASTASCAACRAVHYCCREHQKQHWKQHKLACRPWKISETPADGRFMVATRTIQPGEVIVCEPPLVVGPRQVTPPICLGCHRPVTWDSRSGQLAPPAVRCGRCSWSLCRPDCTSWHSSDECCTWAGARHTLNLMPAASGAAPVYGCIAPLRCLLLRRQPEAWASLSSLQHHLESRRNTQLYRRSVAQLADFLTSTLPDDVTDADVVLTMCAMLDTNSFEVRGVGGSRVRAVFAAASLLNHDCRPNTRHTFDDDCRITVRAAVKIEVGQSITTSYTQPLWDTIARRQHLSLSKCFRCECERCRDPTELGTLLGSVACPSCQGSLLSGNPADPATPWSCSSCHHAMDAHWVLARREDMARLLAAAPRTVAGLETALAAADPFCSQRAELAYALVQLYGAADGFTWHELSEQQLRRKQQLCEQLLQLADVLTPGQTRFRGVLSLELARTRRHLLGITNCSEKQEQWQQTRAILQHASEILALEPGWTQELQLELELLESGQACQRPTHLGKPAA